MPGKRNATAIGKDEEDSKNKQRRSKRRTSKRDDDENSKNKHRRSTNRQMTDKSQQSKTEETPKRAHPQQRRVPVIPAPENCHTANEPKYKMTDAEAMNQAEKWAEQTLRKGVQGLIDEFMQHLRHFMPADSSSNAFRAHANKNRYPDVPCEDKSRVVLKWPANRQDDYIHANYVATPNFRKRFICTQGPLPTTVDDFWHMIIQEDVQLIVMLCNTEENGFPKCAPYWPTSVGEEMEFNRVSVRNAKVEQPPPNIVDEPNIRRSKLELRFTQGGVPKTRTINHYHWTDWPDRGVPPTSLTAMGVLSCVRGSRRPILVHCAAGIGRTGTIVSIEYVIERFLDGLSCEDMVEVVRGLRKQRLFSIQNFQQYLFVHRVLLMYFIDKYKKVAQSAAMQRLYEQFKRDYDEKVGGQR